MEYGDELGQYDMEAAHPEMHAKSPALPFQPIESDASEDVGVRKEKSGKGFSIAGAVSARRSPRD